MKMHMAEHGAEVRKRVDLPHCSGVKGYIALVSIY